MSLEEPKKEKKQGRESLLTELDNKTNDLNTRKKKGWVIEEEYNAEKERLEEERLEVLTNPNLG